MNNRFKFRYWDHFNEEMVYQKENTIGGMRQLFEWAHEAEKGGNKIELMQWTGLQDSSGKDVYGGDIIKHPKGDIGEVIWQVQGQFRVQYIDNPFSTLPLFLQIGERGQAIVIGNIYQNPELLKCPPAKS